MTIKHGRGHVVEFDGPRGLGTIESEQGTRLRFHCTQLVDGTRDIAVGTAVRYEVVPGALGDWEAAAVESLS